MDLKLSSIGAERPPEPRLTLRLRPDDNLSNHSEGDMDATAHELFIAAIHDRQRVLLTFITKDGERRDRTCAPLDYGPRARASDQSDCFHFWDFDSPSGPHPVALLPTQIVEIAPIDEYFDPAAFVSWDLREHPWNVTRDWGPYS